jgi:hypothetical protein
MTFAGIDGGENWDQSYAGAGVVDSAAQTLKSIQDGDWLSTGDPQAVQDAAQTFYQAAQNLDTVAAGMLIATCRGFIRDLLTEFAWWLVKKGTIALAAAPYTGGGSLAARLAKKFADKLNTLVRDLSGLFTMMRDLAQFLGSPTRRGFGVSLAKSYFPSLAKKVDDDVSLSAANAAEQQVEDRRRAYRNQRRRVLRSRRDRKEAPQGDEG